nr:histone deacetylase 14 [Tanacetum cinerariifolium]
KIADVNASSGQTPTMAPPVRADDQILPHIRWVPIGKSNCYLDLEKSQSNPIYKIARKHRFHPRPDSPLHLSNEEPVLGYLKFCAKGTRSKVFGMPIPDSLITTEIRQATYYREYLAKVTHHRNYLAGETGGVQNLPAPRPTQSSRKPKAPTRLSISIPATETIDKPAKAKRFKRSISRKTRQPRSSPKSVGASEAEEVPAEEPQVADEDVDYLKVVEESMKDAYALPKGQLPLVVIREPESGKYQPLLEVPGKGKAKVTEEQVSYDLLNSEEESEKAVLGAEESGQDKSQVGPDLDAQAKDQTGSDVGAQAEDQAGSNPAETSKGQAGSNPDETSKCQAGPEPSDDEANVKSISSPVVHARSDREHMDLDVADVSPQPSTEQLDEGFTATVYPNI